MFNLDKKHLTDPFELEKADCLLSLYLLQNICKDKDSFCKILKTCSSYIKVGGYLILIGTFNGEYFIIGDHKFHILNYDEEFLRKAVAEAGFTIDHLQIFEKTAVTDSIKYGNMYCLRALKEREV
ncbi:nicotinamide N-methyltransferase-like [Pseudophryne corroboree]|uniref:nicotinamide N-methyltransferase-like n=1 Tax=Pseudophryne corroboree TaxID=495146 RepID=UPI003081F5FE